MSLENGEPRGPIFKPSPRGASWGPQLSDDGYTLDLHRSNVGDNMLYNVGPPVISWFVNPMKTIVI